MENFFKTTHFSFGFYGYATASAQVDNGKLAGVIVIPLQYHLPNNIYMINKSVYPGTLLVDTGGYAHYESKEKDETEYQKVQKINVNPAFDETYRTYVKNQKELTL